MPLRNPEVEKILREKKHDYTKLNIDELSRAIAAASHQDVGNYGGQFVGFCAYMELVRRENNEISEQNKQLALTSIKIAKRSLYTAIASTVIAVLSFAISFFKA